VRPEASGTAGRHVSETTDALATFDFAAFFSAVDEARRRQGLHWYAFADELWDLSVQLNAERDDHPLCGGAVSRLGARGETSCQYALYMLRWLGDAPEAFLVGPAVDVGDTRLPEPGPDSRLRWDLAPTADSAGTCPSSMPRSTSSGGSRASRGRDWPITSAARPLG